MNVIFFYANKTNKKISLALFLLFLLASNVYSWSNNVDNLSYFLLKKYISNGVGLHYGDIVPSFSEAPFMAKLVIKMDKSHTVSCGAVFVKKNYLLTAAHCLLDKEKNKYSNAYMFVKYGGVDLDEFNSFTTAGVLYYKIYPEYFNRSSLVDEDVAIIKIPNEANTKNVEPLKIMDFDDAKNYLVTAMPLNTYGWGRISFQSNEDSKKLLHIQVRYADSERVKSMLEYKGKDFYLFNSLTMIGAFSPTGRVTDKGDSGGPLIAPCYGWRKCLVGIASWSPNDGVLSIFTNVSTATDIRAWIIEQINKE